MSIPSAYERALERTAHIPAAEPKKAPEPVVEVPMTFDEFVEVMRVMDRSGFYGSSECKRTWNAAIEAAAQIVANTDYDEWPTFLEAAIRARKVE